MRHLTASDFQVSTWSGGRTIQIAISPEGAAYADRDFLVLMATPENANDDFERVAAALGLGSDVPPPVLPLAKAETVLSPREALFRPRERVNTEDAIGRVCTAPLVSCPPAIPVIVSGERVPPDALPLFQYYNIREVDVIKDA